MNLGERAFNIGRHLTTRGDGVTWYVYGLWITGKGPFIPVGSRRRFSIEYTRGVSKKDRTEEGK